MRGCLKNIYMGETAAEMEKTIRRAIARGRSIPGLYLITFASNGTDQLDILHSQLLGQKRIREQLPPVVGFGIGREETLSLIPRIARDAFLATGRCRLQEYLLSIQPEGAQ